MVPQRPLLLILTETATNE